jgi:D-alanyl-D-alanine carboxypeptidase
MTTSFTSPISAVIVLSAVAFCSCARDARPLEVRLTEALTDGLKKHDVKGASVALILADDSLRCVTGGWSHDSIAVRPEMLIAAGSITKNFVAALILQLAEEGRLTLDDSLHRWLPPYRYVDSTITIRQLLAHTSGVYMFWENQKLWDDLIAYRDSAFTPEAVLSYLKEPHFPPGEGFRYSNTNYLLLAMIATRATGQKLSVELRRRFWEPLRLHDTFLSVEETFPPERLLHVWGDNFETGTPVRDITYLPRTSHETITYGSSGVITTPADLARWGHALFGGKVLKPSSLAAMLEIDDDNYGLGVHRFATKFSGGETAVGHGGGNIGMMTYMIHSLERRATLVVTINSFNSKCLNDITDSLAKIILDHLSHPDPSQG